MGAPSVRSHASKAATQSASRYERMRENGVVACSAVLLVLDSSMPDQDKVAYLRGLCSDEDVQPVASKPAVDWASQPAYCLPRDAR